MDRQVDQRGSQLVSTDVQARHRFLPTRTGVIELVVLFTLLLLVERLGMAPGDFAKLQPHPFWLPVILLGLQYGTADGLLAAAVAIIIGVLLGWPTQGVGEDYYRYFVRVWAVPIGWILTAIVIGEVRARQRSQIAMLNQDLLTTRGQAEDITNHCHKLEDKIQRIEREFATIEAVSLDSLASYLQQLQAGGVADWQTALARVHRGVLGTGTLRLLVRTETAVIAIARTSFATDSRTHAGHGFAGDTDTSALPAVVDKVIAGGRLFSALNHDDAVVLQGLGAMAIAVIANPAGWAIGPETRGLEPRGHEVKSRVAGILLLDAIAPERLTFDTENRLSLLAREMAHVFAGRGVADLIEAAGPADHLAVPDSRLELADPVTAETATRRIGIFPRFGRA